MIHIENKGYISKSNNQSVNKTEWDGEYNGEDGVFNIRSDTDGESKEMRIEFDNNDLAKLLTMPHVNEPLTDRLKTAFLDQEYKEHKESPRKKQDTSFPLIPVKSIAHLDILPPHRRHTKKYVLHKNKPKRVKSQRRQVYRNR